MGHIIQGDFSRRNLDLHFLKKAENRKERWAEERTERRISRAIELSKNKNRRLA